ncbi:hypothetical protein CR513_62332, partial [Mucuna pruriens]
MFLGENLATLRSKKQNVLAQSSVEAEFQSMPQGYKYEAPTRLFFGNKSTISIVHNSVQDDKRNI